jgi:hypothetical protein
MIHRGERIRLGAVFVWTTGIIESARDEDFEST